MQPFERRMLIQRLRHVRSKKSNISRVQELYYTFVFAVSFGVLSALLSELVDNIVRLNLEYPIWYVWTVFILFGLTVFGLIMMFVSLRAEQRDIQIMEKNFEEMLPEEEL